MSKRTYESDSSDSDNEDSKRSRVEPTTTIVNFVPLTPREVVFDIPELVNSILNVDGNSDSTYTTIDDLLALWTAFYNMRGLSSKGQPTGLLQQTESVLTSKYAVKKTTRFYLQALFEDPERVPRDKNGRISLIDGMSIPQFLDGLIQLDDMLEFEDNLKTLHIMDLTRFKNCVRNIEMGTSQQPNILQSLSWAPRSQFHLYLFKTYPPHLFRLRDTTRRRPFFIEQAERHVDLEPLMEFAFVHGYIDHARAIFSRIDNPDRDTFEERIAVLEYVDTTFVPHPLGMMWSQTVDYLNSLKKKVIQLAGSSSTVNNNNDDFDIPYIDKINDVDSGYGPFKGYHSVLNEAHHASSKNAVCKDILRCIQTICLGEALRRPASELRILCRLMGNWVKQNAAIISLPSNLVAYTYPALFMTNRRIDTGWLSPAAASILLESYFPDRPDSTAVEQILRRCLMDGFFNNERRNIFLGAISTFKPVDNPWRSRYFRVVLPYAPVEFLMKRLFRKVDYKIYQYVFRPSHASLIDLPQYLRFVKSEPYRSCLDWFIVRMGTRVNNDIDRISYQRLFNQLMEKQTHSMGDAPSFPIWWYLRLATALDVNYPQQSIEIDLNLVLIQAYRNICDLTFYLLRNHMEDSNDVSEDHAVNLVKAYADHLLKSPLLARASFMMTISSGDEHMERISTINKIFYKTLDQWEKLAQLTQLPVPIPRPSYHTVPTLRFFRKMFVYHLKLLNQLNTQWGRVTTSRQTWLKDYGPFEYAQCLHMLLIPTMIPLNINVWDVIASLELENLGMLSITPNVAMTPDNQRQLVEAKEKTLDFVIRMFQAITNIANPPRRSPDEKQRRDDNIYLLQGASIILNAWWTNVPNEKRSSGFTRAVVNNKLRELLGYGDLSAIYPWLDADRDNLVTCLVALKSEKMITFGLSNDTTVEEFLTLLDRVSYHTNVQEILAELDQGYTFRIHMKSVSFDGLLSFTNKSDKLFAQWTEPTYITILEMWLTD